MVKERERERERERAPREERRAFPPCSRSISTTTSHTSSETSFSEVTVSITLAPTGGRKIVKLNQKKQKTEK